MKLQRIVEIATGTSAFYFERPADFDFVPGQFVEIVLEAESPSDPYRSFSIASAPCESHLMIATRNRNSAFKRALCSLPMGSEVPIEGPYGKFGLQPGNGGPHVFIAGGMGITPLRSILTQAAADGGPQKTVLFYANRDITSAAYMQELIDLARASSTFTFIPILTRASAEWTGECGHVDEMMLSRYLETLDATFYVCGPSAMVEGSVAVLADLGVGKDRILSESFEGY